MTNFNFDLDNLSRSFFMPKFQLFFLQIMVTISLDNPHELDEFHQPYTKRLDAENQDDRINLESQRAMKNVC
ncbi:hypothetical protein HMPREF0508_01238 [Lactobacillus crispatus MV-3A-US]|nr:hypothetical protein HMPREF0508_01238 [Lactobacillus crispatus MV-3A-US]